MSNNNTYFCKDQAVGAGTFINWGTICNISDEELSKIDLDTFEKRTITVQCLNFLRNLKDITVKRATLEALGITPEISQLGIKTDYTESDSLFPQNTICSLIYPTGGYSSFNRAYAYHPFFDMNTYLFSNAASPIIPICIGNILLEMHAQRRNISIEKIPVRESIYIRRFADSFGNLMNYNYVTALSISELYQAFLDNGLRRSKPSYNITKTNQIPAVITLNMTVQLINPQMKLCLTINVPFQMIADDFVSPIMFATGYKDILRDSKNVSDSNVSGKLDPNSVEKKLRKLIHNHSDEEESDEEESNHDDDDEDDVCSPTDPTAPPA